MATKFGKKMGYNLVCVKDICKIFASVKGFRKWVSECCQSNFTPTDLRRNVNEILDEVGKWVKFDWQHSLTHFRHMYEISSRFLHLARGFLKLQKKTILFSSILPHSQCDAGNITFCNFCCFRCASA